MSFRKINKISSKFLNGSRILTIKKINKTRINFSKINNFAKKRPLTFGAGFAFFKTLGADLVVQTYLENKKISEINWKRNISIGIFGLFYTGIFQYGLYGKFYPYIFKILLKNKCRKIQTITQLSLDLLIHTPLVYFPVFYLYKNLNNKEYSLYNNYFCDSIGRDIPKMWGVWLPAHILTFSLIPPHLRIPWITSVSFVWTMILSYSTN